jgi:hypothetical protein
VPLLPQSVKVDAVKCSCTRNISQVSTLRSNQIIGYINSTGDYIIQFKVKPTGFIADPDWWGSLLHFTSTGTFCCSTFGQRNPAFWFYPYNFFPNQFKLHVSIGDSGNWNYGVDPSLSLPINEFTLVTLLARGKQVLLVVGDEVVETVQPTYRLSGYTTVYGSNNFDPSALAEIADICYTFL